MAIGRWLIVRGGRDLAYAALAKVNSSTSYFSLERRSRRTRRRHGQSPTMCAYDERPLRRRRRRRDDHARPARHPQRAVRRAARRADRARSTRARDDDGRALRRAGLHAREGVLARAATSAGFAADVPLVHKHFGTERFPRLFRLIGELGKPSICAANGHVLAGALGIALACDLIVAARGRDVRHARDQRRRVPVHDHGADLPQRPAQEDQRAAAARRADRRRARPSGSGSSTGSSPPRSSTPPWPTGRGSWRRKSPVLMRLGKDAMFRQQDMALRRRARVPARAADARVLDRGHPGGRHGVLREARAAVEGPMSALAPAGLPDACRPACAGTCPSAPRRLAPTAPGRWRRQALARPSLRARHDRAVVGSPGRAARDRDCADDLRDSRGCLLEAGGQLEDALAPGASRCCRRGLLDLRDDAARRSRATAPTRCVLWLDAHGDFNTPDDHASRLPRRHVPGRRLRRLGHGPGRGAGWTPRASCMCGVRDLDPGERVLLETHGVGAHRAARAARRRASPARDVFVHLDLDVLDPSALPGPPSRRRRLQRRGPARRCSPRSRAAATSSASRSPARRRRESRPAVAALLAPTASARATDAARTAA